MQLAKTARQKQRFAGYSSLLVLVSLVTMIPGALFAQDAETADRKVIVCSTTQVADFARQVVGDRWEVRCVLGPGEDPHTYSTGVDDLNSVKEADLCLENGWHLEGNEWMKALAEQAGKPLVTCVTGIEGIDIDEDGEVVKDPHAWFDPRNAWIYTKNIRDAVIELDPENEAEYRARAALYQSQLRLLDGWIKSQLNQVDVRLLVTHHDAFGYFCEQYDFQAMSPVGWNTGELAGMSAETRQEIVDGIRELGVKALFVESTVNSKTLDEIASDAGVEIGGTLYSDAMGAEGTAGETYLGMMRENVLTIVNALK
ncbi:MAG: zinc ABC transporter substrate-binding protein [Planctomycetota bacterium]